MPKYVLWIALAVYLAAVSIAAVVVTIRDKKIAVKNGQLEELASRKSKGSASAGKKKDTPKKTAGKKAGSSKNNSSKKTTGNTKSKKESTHKTPTAIRRVPEKTLLVISALGGSIAMLLTMRAIRHKTQHAKFMIGIPAIIVAQCLLVVALVVLI